MDTENKRASFHELIGHVSKGRLSRRAFVARAGALGLTATAANLIMTGIQTGVAAAKTQTGNILISPPVTNNVWWDGWVKAANDAAKVLGMQSTVLATNGDTQAQISAFQNAKNVGYAGAITMANIAAVSPQLMQVCQRDQVYCYNSHSEQPWVTPLDIGDYFVGHLEFPHQGSVEAVATYLFEKMGGHGKIFHITGVPGVNASDLGDFGLDQVLKRYPGIKLLARQPGYYGRVKTIPVVENLLTSFPDVDAIVAQNDDEALGVVTVLKQKNLLGKVKVVGCDAVPEILDAIEFGDVLASVVNPGEWMGGYMMVRIFDAMNGVKYDPLERMQMFETFVLNTKEAAAEYRKLQQAGFPYDWRKMSRFLYPHDWDVQIGLRQLNPEVFWRAFGGQKPATYQLPKPYRDATQAQYDALDAMYAAHLKKNLLDPTKALVEPLVPVPPNNYWTTTG